MPVNSVRCQTILPTIVIMSAAEKARNYSVRTSPSPPRLKLSAKAEDSSRASTIGPQIDLHHLLREWNENDETVASPG